MKKYLKLLICIFSLLMACILGGCGSKNEDTVSKGVETVIDTMLTCPNNELCSSISVIGMGTEEYYKSLQKKQGRWKQIFDGAAVATNRKSNAADGRIDKEI